MLPRLYCLALLLVALPLLVHAASAPTASSAVADAGSSALVFPAAVSGRDAHAPVDLTSANFFDLVLDSRQAWIVAFVAPWCGHCRALEEPFAAASRAMVSAVRFGRVDCTAQTSLASQFQVSSYPTVMIFPPGAKKPKLIRKYEGGRDQRSLSDAAHALLNLKNIKRISSVTSAKGGGGNSFPASFVSFFAGRAQNQWASAARPSLVVFLHAHKPSPELQGLSQAFQGRVNFGVVEQGDKILRRIMRVTSNPTYIACVPALTTRTNVTGIVECMRYEHADQSKGGSTVQAVSHFLVEFIKATTAATAGSNGDAPVEPVAVRAKYPTIRRFVIDEELTKEAGADAAAEASSERAAVLLSRPAPVLSLPDFHARCTDLSSGVCLLVFAEPTSASLAASPLPALFASIDAWNLVHASRRSFKVFPLVLSSSSAAAAALTALYSIPLDSSALGVTLLALLPSRNRFVPYDHLGAFRPEAAAEWIESVVRDEKRVRPQKLANMQERVRTVLKEAEEDSDGASLFQSTLLSAAPSSSDTGPTRPHDEL